MRFIDESPDLKCISIEWMVKTIIFHHRGHREHRKISMFFLCALCVLSVFSVVKIFPLRTHSPENRYK